MRNSCNSRLEIPSRSILDEAVPHPWEIGAPFDFLVTAVEEAVVALIKVLVSLVEVDHFVIDLR